MNGNGLLGHLKIHLETRQGLKECVLITFCVGDKPLPRLLFASVNLMTQ